MTTRITGGDDGSPAPARTPLFHRVLPAREDHVRAALVDLRTRFAGIDADAMGRAELVLAEVMNNIVQHGTGRGKMPEPGAAAAPVTIHLSVSCHQDGALACAVTDDGPPLPPGCLLATATAEPVSAAGPCGGFGWPIIRALAQALFYFREGPRNVLCFSVPLRRDHGACRETRPDVA